MAFSHACKISMRNGKPGNAWFAGEICQKSSPKTGGEPSQLLKLTAITQERVMLRTFALELP
jgi:hypothetical protein